MTGIVECPHCYIRVLPMKNNICPACRMDMSDVQDVDINMTALTVHESDSLPPICYLCNNYTDRSVRIETDEESPLETIIRILDFLLPPWRFRTSRNPTNIVIDLPQCYLCSEKEDPTPLRVDYDDRTMTFVVHIGFKERVQPTLIDTAPSESDENDEDEISE